MVMDVDARNRRYGALDLIAQPVWLFDFDLRRIHWANRAALAVWCDTSLERLCMRDLGSDMSDSVATRLDQFRQDFLSHDAVFVEQWTIYPAGRPVPLTVRASGHRLDDGRMAMLCEASPSAIEQPESLRSVEALVHTAVMITLYGRDGQPLYRNPAARAAACAPDERLEDRMVDPLAHDALFDELARAGTATRTLEVCTADGGRWHEISARRCRDAVTGQDALLVSEVDVSAIKNAESRAQFLALRDPLTSLANRSQVMRRFSESVEGMLDAGMQAALMFIDLDHFKDVNDTLGHAAGDALLVEVAYRLREVVRENDLVARLGGDEFLILLVARDVRAEVERTRQRILHAISEPFEVHDHEVRITPSIGVSLYPRDGTDVHTLLRNADLAMYTAKELGRNDLAYYDTRMSDAVRSRIALETDLRRALERGEVEVAYQPIVDVDNGRIVGAEALARWRHPERGMIPPGVFIPIAENTGLIRAIGSFVFRSAARQQVAWRRNGDALQVSVNLSGRQLRLGELLPDLTGALEEVGGDPRLMQVEITESMLLGNDDAVLDVLHAVEALGLTIVLDDFGTGYSNLGYLQRFPIRELKIDRSFIQGIDTNRAVAEMIVSMCRLMRLSVVAEGVETAEQFAWVKAHGIERCQGYLFSEPLPANAFTALLSTQPFLVEA